MSYQAFSKIYDRLIAEDIDYGKTCDFIENIFDIYGISPELVLDMACGTGGVTIPMSERGYDMIGVDASFDMLLVAKGKKGAEDILFLNQPIERLDLYGSVGAVLCMTDGFNYILSDKTLLLALKRLRTCFMDKGAVLVFDVSTVFKLKDYHGDKTYIYDKNDIFYAWENRYYPKKKLSQMTINFFKKTESGYKRIVERQLQRARTTKEIKNILKKAGFSDIRIFSSTELGGETEDCNRIWVSCRN